MTVTVTTDKEPNSVNINKRPVLQRKIIKNFQPFCDCLLAMTKSVAWITSSRPKSDILLVVFNIVAPRDRLHTSVALASSLRNKKVN